MKRLLLILCLLSLPVTAGAQTQLPRVWTCSLAGLAATLTECQAVPGTAGERYVITDIVVQTTTATAGSYSIQTGTGTNCGTGTAALFPVNSTSARFVAPIAANPTAMISLRTPLVAPADAAVCVIGTATNTINVQLVGFITR